MPKAFVVRVMTKERFDGDRLIRLYAVVLDGQQDALQVVCSKAGPDVDVEVVGQITAGTVQALQLTAGQISML